MNSFLVELEKNYDLFNVTKGEIIKLFHIPSDIDKLFIYLFKEKNDYYFKRCTEMKRDPNKLGKISIEKDASGKCYLKIVGNDDHTILIIRQNDSRFEDYRNTIGSKITEEEFIDTLNRLQIKRVEEANIPSRFLKEVVPPINICEEMNISELIDYYHYVNNYLTLSDSLITFDEPENSVGSRRRIGNGTTPRKNEVIDYKLRRDELMKRNPIKIISCSGNKNGSSLDAFIYDNDGLLLAVIEPVSGLGYQYNLNLGDIDKNNIGLIEEMIKAALEASEDIVMMDSAIMRKNHTTIEAFSENLDIFLKNAKIYKPFYYDVKKSNNVYGR